MKQFVTVLVMVATVAAYAALPPYHESVRQMKSVIQSADVQGGFEGGAGMITAIRRGKGFDGFTVFAPIGEKACELDVKVGFQSPGGDFVGPFPILLTVGKVRCDQWTSSLPPYAESVRLITAVLESKDVAARFGSGSMIEGIEQASDFFGYIVSGYRDEKLCSVNVQVNYQPQDPPKPGPAPFELEVGELECEEAR